MFSSLLEPLFTQSILDDVFGLRRKAWDKAQRLGLPDKNGELYQYVPLRAFYGTTFNPRAISADLEQLIQQEIHRHPSQHRIVLIDGKLHSGYSSLPSNTILCDLKEAAVSYRSYFTKRLGLSLEENDPFVLLNLALYDHGFFLYLPPKTVIDGPVLILQVLTAPCSFPRFHIHAGAYSAFSYTFKVLTATEAPCFHNAYFDFSLDENAKLNCCQLNNAGPNLWDFSFLRATLKRDAHLESLNFTTGSKSTRTDIRVSLLQEGSHAELKGLSVLSNGDQAHSVTYVEHSAPNCQSLQHFKNVLSGHSQSSFTGKIFVHAEAQQTQAYQLNNNLLLDKNAIAQTKPGLEIFADDVKASHGATISQMNPEDLLYLQTRGIDPSSAKRLLIRGFCQELANLIQDPIAKNEVLAWIK